MIEIVLNILAAIGIFLIIFGYLKYYNLYLELIADFLIIISTMCIILSIYLPNNIRQPEEISKYFTAPFLLFSLSIMLIHWALTRKKIQLISIKGIAILGISGALFRL